MRPSLLSIACVATALVGPAMAQQSPALPDAVIDLRTQEGASLVGGKWRYTEADIVDAENHALGPDHKPSGAVLQTHDIRPRFGTPEFESAPWREIAAIDLETRRTNGRLAFAWYRFDLTVPPEVNGLSTEGSTIVLELVIDDYSEVRVDGTLPLALGQTDGSVIGGWNAPNRVTLTRNATPGQQIQLAIFAANGPLSDPPANFVWIRSATLDLYRPGRLPRVEPVATEITRLSPAMDNIVAPGASAERVAQGFAFVEGPVWVPHVTDNRYGGGGLGGYLLFSDPNKNVIHRYDPLSGDISIFRTKSGYSGIGRRNIGEYHQPGSNGLALDASGRLTICEHGNRRVTRLEPNGSLTVLADSYQGKRLNSPNDLVYRSDGLLYITDPPFGLPGVFDDPQKELPFNGVYLVRNGVVELASSDLAAPNGLAFSPDEKHLYVDNWQESRKVIMRYDVASDGSLSHQTVFADLTSTTGEICLDGLKVDEHGNVFAAGPGGIWVFSAERHHLGTVALPEPPANFAFGDQDRRTLYVAARSSLYRLRLRVSGGEVSMKLR